MRSKYSTVEQSHVDAGDGAERTVTQARGGVRRGMLKVLLISTVLAVAGIGAIVLVVSRSHRHPTLAHAAAPGGAGSATTLASPTWDSDHLGANGLEKCQAFRLVVKHTRYFQEVGGGAISAAQRADLQVELGVADAMPPKSLTPTQCGVPL